VPAPAVRRARYLKPLRDYVDVYNRSERTLKLLVAKGRDATPPELPPFDEPGRMKDWWVKHMKNRVPDDIAAHAASSAPLPSTPAPAATPAGPADSPGPLFSAAATAGAAGSPAPAAPAVAIPILPPALSAAGGGLGYRAALQRTREAEAAAGQLYNQLLGQANRTDLTIDDRSKYAAEAERARRAWDEVINRLRQMEKDAAEILRGQGRTWPVEDVLTSQDIIHLALHQGLLGLLRRIRPKLAALRDPDAEDALWSAELEKLFAGLRENKFTAPPAAAAAA